MIRAGFFCCVFWVFPLLLSAQSDQITDIVESNVTSFRSVNTQSQVVASEDGDVIVGWRSARKGVPYNNIYLQKVDQAGTVVWEMDGTPMSPNPANQDNFSMVGDGYGGVVIVWEDFRFGSDHPAIFAQRVNLRGEPLWGISGTQLCEGKGGQRKPKIVSDRRNGFYVVWEDFRRGYSEGDLYGQFVDLGGKARWMKAGMPIATAPRLQKNFQLATDEKQFLYVIWEDFRNGLYWNLFAQKINMDGDFFWKAGGLDVFAGVEENHNNPQIVTDGYGGLLFVYEKYSPASHGTDIYRGRLNSNGELVFHFATCYSQDEQLNPRIVKKGSKALLVWEDRRNGNWDLFAQMIRLKDGILEWGINGIPVIKSPEDERDPVVISAASYGYQVFSWLRKEGDVTRIYVQKMNNLGEPAWGESGKMVCEYSDRQLEPAILPDEAGGLWCSWTDRREAGTASVYLQHINGYGLRLLPKRGLKLGSEHSSPFAKVSGVKAVAARNGHFFVVWEDFRNGDSNSDLYIQKLDGKGAPLWRRNGIPVCLAPGDQNRPVLIDDGVGGVIVGWADRRNGKDDNIYAQRVSAWGKLLWRSDGVKVCDAKADQSGLRGIADGREGAIFCWVDARSVATTGFDLYIQRLSHDGEPLWGPNGKPFARYDGLQTSPTLASDGNGGAFLSWMDSRAAFSNIYSQHINEFGIYEWEYGGRCLVPMATHQRHPEMARNFQNDLYLVWQEGRYGDGFEKLFMQCITPSGAKLWDQKGLLVCEYPGRQGNPMIVTDAYGSFWVAWLDERDKDRMGVQLMIQKFDIGGEPQWQREGIAVGESMEEWNDYELQINAKGHAYVVWNQATASGLKNVFYQKINVDGQKKYGYSGMRMGGEEEQQISPNLALNVDGRVLVVWVQNDPNDNNFGIRGAFVKE